MRFGTLMIAAVVAAGVALPAFAQKTYSIGTNKQGSLGFGVGTAVSKLMNDKAGLLFRVKPGGGSSSLVPQMNAGKVDFGVNNAAESRFARFGTGIFEGKVHKNFRLVGMVYPLRIDLAVPFDSPIKTVADAKGMRMGNKFTAQAILQFIQSALLANGGLSQEDMKNTPYASYLPTGDDMARGKLDIATVSPGAGASKKQHAMLKSRGGLRFLSISDDPAAVKRMQGVYPESFVMTIHPSPATPGVVGPTNVIAYPYFLTTGTHVSADVIYKLVKTMHANKAYLKAANSRFNLFEPTKMKATSPVEYHPGALKAYKELGVM
ncbi:MAG: TAXI family TRAP transporter solute-binding subunit [Proteobacteria bacterium]|nr:TAXI family TRAP transporter solute-binding subunit [Pseudomonadota bacterium]